MIHAPLLVSQTYHTVHLVQRSLEVSWLLIVPFVLMLLAIALLPLIAGHWWEHNGNKIFVSLALGLPIAGYLLLQGEAGWHSVLHTLREYAEFMVLLGALYIISG